MNGQISDKELLNTLLNEHKLQASSINNLILECTNPQLRQDCISILQSVYTHQEQLFNTMQQQGWYQPQQANPQDISKTHQQLQSDLQQSQ